MTFSSFVAFVESLPGLIVSFFERPPAPIAPIAGPGKPISTQDPVANLKAIILANTIAMKTLAGGEIHQLNAEEAQTVAQALVNAAAKYELSLSLVAAQVRAESDFDPQSFDNNVALSKPGETPQQLFAHSDLGIEQEDGAVADADPAFAALPLAEREAKLYDLDYGVDYLCKTLKANLDWANAMAMAAPELMAKVPNNDIRIPALGAYNTGQHGMVEQLRSDVPNLKYGIKAVANADAWKPLLG